MNSFLNETLAAGVPSHSVAIKALSYVASSIGCWLFSRLAGKWKELRELAGMGMPPTLVYAKLASRCAPASWAAYPAMTVIAQLPCEQKFKDHCASDQVNSRRLHQSADRSKVSWPSMLRARDAFRLRPAILVSIVADSDLPK